ncbi:denn domain containing protein, putative [Entamoeba invadens IP1]|uniref:Denn domain containing protein, putative n=1 Tax=Entamoeba invadens IP1 TaxID=370355 RepID=A0A0A1UH72_ENTIV|nr:denn domain containing protein, putative [Entamoeba invadens IP1]ELP94817.1 denn domain containing protein, putative [Entamoeba invadens IP1]|eukprot:XP_004261588.1 denn domain containing protein, putative [Entamoeba invadens IP1]
MDGAIPTRPGFLLNGIFLFKPNDMLSFDSSTTSPFSVPFRLPIHSDKIDTTLFEFAFPDNDLTSSEKKTDHFTFVLTDLDGRRSYCYCRRELHHTSQCLIFVSHFKKFSLIYAMIDFLFAKQENPELFSQIAKDFFEATYPSASSKIFSSKFNYSFSTSSRDNVDPPYIVSSFFLKLFGASLFVDVFSNLLLERKFIFISESLQTLSIAIHTFSSLIHPFVWQHILIPILPPKMLDLAHAPMPFIIGCTSSTFLQLAEEVDISDVYVFNVDAREFLSFPVYPLLFNTVRSVFLKSSLFKVQKNIMSSSLNKTKPTENFDVLVSDFLFQFLRDSFNFYPTKIEIDTKSPRHTKTIKLVGDEHPDKTFRPFFTEFLNCQICDVYFAKREEELNAGEDITKICPLLYNYSNFTIFYSKCYEMSSFFGYANVRCRNCGLPIMNTAPCTVECGGICHVECFRCTVCWRIMLGDLSHSEIVKGGTCVCVLCKKSGRSGIKRSEKEYQDALSKKEKSSLVNLTEYISSKKEKYKKKNTVVFDRVSAGVTPSPIVPSSTNTPREDLKNQTKFFDFNVAERARSTAPSIAFDFLGNQKESLEGFEDTERDFNGGTKQQKSEKNEGKQHKVDDIFALFENSTKDSVQTERNTKPLNGGRELKAQSIDDFFDFKKSPSGFDVLGTNTDMGNNTNSGKAQTEQEKPLFDLSFL